MKTVLITGASSGIGKETAIYFQKKGWNVAAAMRSPDKEKDLVKIENIKCFKMDVTDRGSVDRAVQEILDHFGGFDVLVNNAGIGTKGLFEAATSEGVEKQFDVNVFGLMNVTWAVLPHFRGRKGGTIINISSQAGIMGVPLNSLYNSTKYAVEGFSESLMYELSTINIKVKLILLAAIRSNFLSSTTFFENPLLTDYKRVNSVVIPLMKEYLAGGEEPIVVARKIYKAATDNKDQLRYLAGRGATMSYRLKRILPFRVFSKIIKGWFKI